MNFIFTYYVTVAICPAFVDGFAALLRFALLSLCLCVFFDFWRQSNEFIRNAKAQGSRIKTKAQKPGQKDCLFALFYARIPKVANGHFRTYLPRPSYLLSNNQRIYTVMNIYL